MKILVLIMSHETTDSNFVNYKRVWDEQISKLDTSRFNIEFKFLYSNNEISEEYLIQGNNLITRCYENYWFSLILKVMSGFDYFIKNDFDLVFKTNLSTIINFEKEFTNNVYEIILRQANELAILEEKEEYNYGTGTK